MSMSTKPPFQYLRSKLREWQAADLLRPDECSRRQFRTIATSSLLPLVKALHQAVEAEGLRATIREASQDLGFLSSRSMTSILKSRSPPATSQTPSGCPPAGWEVRTRSSLGCWPTETWAPMSPGSWA